MSPVYTVFTYKHITSKVVQEWLVNWIISFCEHFKCSEMKKQTSNIKYNLLKIDVPCWHGFITFLSIFWSYSYSHPIIISQYSNKHLETLPDAWLSQSLSAQNIGHLCSSFFFNEYAILLVVYGLCPLLYVSV